MIIEKGEEFHKCQYHEPRVTRHNTSDIIFLKYKCDTVCIFGEFFSQRRRLHLYFWHRSLLS